MPAVLENRILAFKKETTRGTYNAPASADADIKFTNVTVTVNVGAEQVKYQGANHAFDPSIMTKADVEISAETYLKGSGTAGTAPACAKLFEMLGFKETVVADTSVTYQRDKTKDCQNTYSASLNDLICNAGTLTQWRLPMAGVVADTMTITAEGAGGYKAVVTFKGKLNGNATDETTLIEYTGFDTTTVPAHLSKSYNIRNVGLYSLFDV